MVPPLWDQLVEDVGMYWNLVEGDFFPGATYDLVRVNDGWAAIAVDYEGETAVAFVDVSGPAVVEATGPAIIGGADMVGVTFALMNVVPRLRNEPSPVVRIIHPSSDDSFDPEPWMIDWAKELVN